MNTMNRLGSVVLSLATVPLLGGCVAAGYPSSAPMYSGSAVVHTRNVSIGINVPIYPSLVRVPGYPVYYAPGVSANYFFYDGVYWVFSNDGWYQSTWYNGPWVYVAPDVVPLFILRVPVRYYRYPPTYFRGWHQDSPPRWGEHWGPQWEQHRHGWDQWNRAGAPAPAPLPHYQRDYSGSKYPRLEQQPELRSQKYRYQPQDPAGRQLYQEREREREQLKVQPQQPAQRGNAPSPQQRLQPTPQERNQRQMESPRSNPPGSNPPAPVQQRSPSMQQQQPARDQQRYQPQPQPRPQIQMQQRQDSSGRGQQPGAGQRGGPQGQGAAPKDNRQQGQGRNNDRDEKQRQDRYP